MRAIRTVLVVVTLAWQVALIRAVTVTERDTISDSWISGFDHDLKITAVSRLILSKLGLEEPPVVSESQLSSVSEAQVATYNLTVEMNKRKMAARAARRLVEDEYYTSRVTTLAVKELPCMYERKI
jgi:hypothetical protein